MSTEELSDSNDIVELYGIHDGYGIVGYGFKCPHCKYRNEFICEDEPIHECSNCKNEITVKPIKY